MNTLDLSETTDDAEQALWDLCEERGWSFGARIEVAYECAWSCEVRLTPHPGNPKGADESRVWYVVGQPTPVHAFNAAASAALTWAKQAES
jgi:hypothetical protein